MTEISVLGSIPPHANFLRALVPSPLTDQEIAATAASFSKTLRGEQTFHSLSSLLIENPQQYRSAAITLPSIKYFPHILHVLKAKEWPFQIIAQCPASSDQPAQYMLICDYIFGTLPATKSKGFLSEAIAQKTVAELLANLLLHVPEQDATEHGLVLFSGGRQSLRIARQTEIFSRNLRYPPDILNAYLRRYKMRGDRLASLLSGVEFEVTRQAKELGIYLEGETASQKVVPLRPQMKNIFEALRS